MKKKIVALMYHGERVPFVGTPLQVFKDKKGKEYRWSGRKHVWFGSVYEAEYMEPGVLAMLKNPKELLATWQPTEKERLEYEAAKLGVTSYRQNRKKAYELKKPHPDLVKAVLLFRPFYFALQNIDRRRLVDWFENECSKPLKKKRRTR